MSLTEKQVQNRCLFASGSTQCRYLEQDPKDWRKFNCLKKLSGRKKSLDLAVNKYLLECRLKGRDPHQAWQSVGDGGTCKGYSYLPSVKQGYDVSSTP